MITCSASRHAAIISTQLEHGETIEEPAYAADSILATVTALWSQRRKGAQLLEVCKELSECAEYWSEYDVPIGIVDRLNNAIKLAEEK